MLSPRRGRGPWSRGHCCTRKRRKYRCFLHRSHFSAQNACSSPLGASGVLEWAAPAPARCPQSARRGCSSPRSVPPGRSKGLLEPPLGATRALEGAAQACSVPQDAPSGCSSLCSVPHVRSERHLEPLLGAARGSSSYLLCHWALDKAFENAARRICLRLHLSSVTLHSDPHYTVHGYARVHTSIYIYIFLHSSYIGVKDCPYGI